MVFLQINQVKKLFRHMEVPTHQSHQRLMRKTWRGFAATVFCKLRQDAQFCE